MKKITLTVDGITRQEYFQACRENGRRLYSTLAVTMVVICGLIILFTGNARPAAFIGPLVVYVVAVAGYEILTHVSYKDQLSVIDPPVEYTFSQGQWTVKNGENTVVVPWQATPKLHKTKLCLFLYNDDASSSLLPLRLLTPEQVEALEGWFQKSRAGSKEYQKKQNRKARQEFRKNHPGLRLGRSGPAWGPWKRKK